MDIRIDTDPISPNYGDAVWVNGPLQKEDTTQPFTRTVGQRLRIRLLTELGEWFLNTDYGVPYFSRILGHKNQKETIDLILQQKVLEEQGVKEIVSFSSTFENRNYSCTFQVRVVSGEVTAPITISPS